MEREPLYQELFDDTLFALLKIHRKNLGVLEQQAAIFTFLHVPTHILTGIDLEEKAIQSVKAELFKRKGDIPELQSEPIIITDETLADRLSQFTGRKLDVIHINWENIPSDEVGLIQENLSRLELYTKQLQVNKSIITISVMSALSFVYFFILFNVANLPEGSGLLSKLMYLLIIIVSVFLITSILSNGILLLRLFIESKLKRPP